MKYFLISVAGLILGVAAATALLYYNPLTLARGSAPDGADRALHYQLPEQSLAFMHGDHALLPGASSEDDQFWEETINRTALLALSMNDGEGAPAAVASRLLQASSDTDLLLRGVLVADHWLLTIPGEGSLFVQVDMNLWPFLKQTFIPTWYFGRAWDGPAVYQPTVGPGHESALIVGATGRFADLAGSAVEQYRFTKLDRESQSVAVAGELHLHLLEQPAGSGKRVAATE